MHKININLPNLKTALIFSMEISRDSSSRHGLRTCQITKIFVAPRPRSPPPPVTEQPKKPGLVRVNGKEDKEVWQITLFAGWTNCTTNDCFPVYYQSREMLAARNTELNAYLLDERRQVAELHEHVEFLKADFMKASEVRMCKLLWGSEVWVYCHEVNERRQVADLQEHVELLKADFMKASEVRVQTVVR